MRALPIRATDRLGQPYVVRGLEPGDRPALETMYVDFEPKRCAQGLPPRDEPSIRRWLDRVLGHGIHIVVELEGQLLGHVMLIPMGDGGAELANFLHQSIRGRGIGTMLNRIALDLARAEGLERLWLSVEPSNRPAIRSYERAGFRRLPGSLWAPEIEMEAPLVETP